MPKVIAGDFRPQKQIGEVAAISLGPRPGDLEGNLLMAERAITEAKAQNPSLGWVVLPELVTCGYTGLSSISRYAEDARRGESARRFTFLARRLGIYIAYGFPERLPDGRMADSASLVGYNGVIVTYRKRHLVPGGWEPEVFAAGDRLPVVTAGGVRVALVICWDLGFPEFVREATFKEAQLILAPAGWRDPYGPQYELSCAARALDSAVYVASANQLGDYPEASFSAPGGVYGPDGARIAGGVGAVDRLLCERWRGEYGCTMGGVLQRMPEAEPGCA